MHTLDLTLFHPDKLFSCFIILLFVISHFLEALAEAFTNQVYDLANLKARLDGRKNKKEWWGLKYNWLKIG